MPYRSIKELPQNVRDKLKSPKKRRQWLKVWNSSYKQNSDESRAFASAWSAVKKFHVGVTEVEDDLNFFMPICKVDKETRTISGYASTNCLDSDGEIVAQEAIKAALPDYMKYGNIREMHRPWAVGVATEANPDGRGLYLTAKIVDDNAWKKVDEGVYKGFSIGGKKLAKVGNTITKLAMSEISIVDRPANPDCMFTVAKMQGSNLVEDDAFLVKIDGVDTKPDENQDDKKAKEKKSQKAEKKAKKLAKRQAKESASQPSPTVHDADGGAEAALGKVQSRHELDLGKTLGGSGNRLSELSLRGEGTEFNSNLKLRKMKGRKMDEKKVDNSALGKALLEFLGGKISSVASPQQHPALGLVKAADSDVKSIKAHRREMEDCTKALFEMHKGALAKSAGSFDHNAAVALIQKMYRSTEAIKSLTKSARDNLEKVASRVSGSGTVEDGTSYYKPDPGGALSLLSPGEMDNLPAHKSGGNAGDLQKTYSPGEVEAIQKLAKLEAENALLKAMPAAPSGGRRPQGYDLSKLGGGAHEVDSTLLKGINPADLSSHDESTRETAVAKMIGNSLLSGRGKPVLDPNFHGTAGFDGRPN